MQCVRAPFKLWASLKTKTAQPCPRNCQTLGAVRGGSNIDDGPAAGAGQQQDARQLVLVLILVLMYDTIGKEEEKVTWLGSLRKMGSRGGEALESREAIMVTWLT